MRELAKIIETSESRIIVEPLISDTCINCTQSCAKRGSPFPVKNPGRLPIEKGCIVRIKASAAKQIVQGIFSLLFPILCAVGGYAIARHFTGSTADAHSENIQAAAVLLFLFAAAMIVLFVSRKKTNIATGIITEIIHSREEEKLSGTTCS